eukprot:scaffold66406_cov66-Phaeocystis_antarctica.AAC.3
MQRAQGAQRCAEGPVRCSGCRGTRASMSAMLPARSTLTGSSTLTAASSTSSAARGRAPSGSAAAAAVDAAASSPSTASAAPSTAPDSSGLAAWVGVRVGSNAAAFGARWARVSEGVQCAGPVVPGQAE